MGWKVRISKRPKRAAFQRYLLKSGGEYKRALTARDGKMGPASDVRHIDPATGQVMFTTPAEKIKQNKHDKPHPDYVKRQSKVVLHRCPIPDCGVMPWDYCQYDECNPWER